MCVINNKPQCLNFSCIVGAFTNKQKVKFTNRLETTVRDA